MKKFIAILIVALISGNSFAAIALVNKVSRTGLGTTSAMDTTGATLLVVITTAYTPPPNADAAGAVTDSNGNTWHSLGHSASNYDCAMWYSYDHSGSALVVGAGHTFTIGASIQFPAFLVMSFSGTLTGSDPYDGNIKINNFTVASTVAPGSITPSTDNQLLVLGFSSANVGYSSNDGGFTTQLNTFSTGNVDGWSGTLIQTTAATSNPTITTGGSGSGAAVLASFKAAGGGGGPTPTFDKKKKLTLLGEL